MSQILEIIKLITMDFLTIFLKIYWTFFLAAEERS